MSSDCITLYHLLSSFSPDFDINLASEADFISCFDFAPRYNINSKRNQRRHKNTKGNIMLLTDRFTKIFQEKYISQKLYINQTPTI